MPQRGCVGDPLCRMRIATTDKSSRPPPLVAPLGPQIHPQPSGDGKTLIVVPVEADYVRQARQHAVSLIPLAACHISAPVPESDRPPLVLHDKRPVRGGVSPPPPFLPLPVRYGASPCVRILRLYFQPASSSRPGSLVANSNSALAHPGALFVLTSR